ncbi:MAG: DUF4391 domain-containing protein [Bacteroidales bacterium]|nr:DUF4391 domain-containing protein [Bacteroidales bacterium]
MLGLPQTTEVRRPLPKAQLYKRFNWKPSQRENFDGSVSHLDFVNWIAPRTLPAIAEGKEVKEIFVVEVSLKSRNFDNKSIVLLAKSIPQRVIYLLRHEDKVQLAVYHTKLFIGPWQSLQASNLTLSGLNLDAAWQNIVAFVGELEVADGDSLTEQIRVDEERARLVRQIESLERLMRSTSQPRRQRELYSEIKKLKASL